MLITRYESRVVTRLDGTTEVAKFDWSMLIPLVLPLITDFISGCLARRGPAAVKASLKAGDFWARYSAERSLRQVLRDENIQMTRKERAVAVAHIVAEASEELIDEVDVNTSGWHLI